MQLPRPACGEGAGGGALFNLSPIEDFSLDLSKIAERSEKKSKCSTYFITKILLRFFLTN